MKAALPIIQSISAKVMDQIEAAGPTQAYDIVDLARRVTAEVIGRWGFKMSFGGDDLSKPNKIVSLMDGLLTAIHRLWFDPFWALKLLTSKEARMDRANTLAFDSFMDSVMRELQARPLDELPSNCIVGALMRATQPSGKPLPFHQLKSNISVMLAAGALD
jgi:cytochrome P450